MILKNTYTEKLFSYGTLQHETVQLATFGRKLKGATDSLVGYQISQLKISDQNVIALSNEKVHSILRYSGSSTDIVKGMVFDISAKELLHADEYEVEDYKRIKIQLVSGVCAWVYVGH